MATGKSKRILEIIVKPFTGRRDRGTKEEEDLQAIAAKEQKIFRYETLAAATGNFSHKLGQGGFGPVFKGRLPDGREAAVKQLAMGSRQGAREFQNEAMLLSRVQHRNVVNLYGYCTHGDEKLLVYEFVPNQSLDKLLFSQDEIPRPTQLDWKRRLDVMAGVARGLLYLHEDAHVPIIHRDIKASNILLDGRWVPKIADFGMARLFPEDQTHVRTRVAGTNGYMAPEYMMHGVLSTKADVFSFGVLVLELIAGRRNSAFSLLPDSEAGSLLEWAWKLYKKGRILDMLDPALKSTVVPEQAAMCAQIGLLCVQADPKLRPDMNRVVIILSKNPAKLEEPTRPGIPGSRYRRSTYGSTIGSSQNTSGDSSYSGNSASTATTAATNNTATTSTTATMISPRPSSPHEETVQSIRHDSGHTSRSARRNSKRPVLYEKQHDIGYDNK